MRDIRNLVQKRFARRPACARMLGHFAVALYPSRRERARGLNPLPYLVL
jgi:hypothetical protein